MITYWAGCNDSLQLVVQAQVKVEALRVTAGMTAGRVDEMLADLPPIWRHEGAVAVIEINGPVVQGDAGWMRLFGVVGYDNIAKAVIEAASDPDTATMLYHINSPGGDVSGIMDIAALLSQISTIKPSSVHTSELMCSAGYWLASAIKDAVITAGATAIVGSIGVLQVHREASKMMEEDGIKVTVLRAGKYKAEMNSVEALTPEAKARAEAQLADVHALFRAQVGRGRPNMSAEDLAESTEGQTFLGKRAVTAGLVDKVGSFELALKLLDKRKHSSNTPTKSKGKAMFLTPEQLAAIAAGTPLQALGLNADGSAMSAEEITAYEASVTNAAETARIAAEAETARLAAEAAAAAAPVEDKGVVALLEKQLATANTEITKLNVAAVAHAAAIASHDGLLAIARGATANMLVPLNASSAAVDGMDAAAIVAEHARVKALFTATFPVGKVSKPAAAPGVKAAIDPNFLRLTAQAKTK